MIFITGDIHGDTRNVVRFVHKMNLTFEDVIILLGGRRSELLSE